MSAEEPRQEESVPDAVPARPWRPEDGPRPVVWTWPPSDPPVLWVQFDGRRWPGTVLAKQVWADGVRYQVSVNLGGDTRTYIRLFRWPQPGLSVAHRSALEPVTGTRA